MEENPPDDVPPDGADGQGEHPMEGCVAPVLIIAAAAVIFLMVALSMLISSFSDRILTLLNISLR